MRRDFIFQEHFQVPTLIPQINDLKGPSNCQYRALTANPSAEVAQRVAAVHEELQTSELQPGLPRSSMDGLDCCRTPSRVLVAMHVRTLWADNRQVAESYTCAPPTAEWKQQAADELHALFVPPRTLLHLPVHLRAREESPGLAASSSTGNNSPEANWPFFRPPTLATMLAMTLATAVRRFGRDAPLSLFVASDSPATRMAAMQIARQRLAQRYPGLRAAVTPGRVRHVLRSSSNATDGGSATAMADLVMLSQADLFVAFTQHSTFPNAAAYMARCTQLQERPAAYYQMLNKLARALFKYFRNDTYARLATKAEQKSADEPECLRDCFQYDVTRKINASTQYGLLALADPKGGTVAVVKRMNSSCRHACACWVQAGLG